MAGDRRRFLSQADHDTARWRRPSADDGLADRDDDHARAAVEPPPANPTKPAPIDPLLALVSSVRLLRWIIVGGMIPIIATGTLAVRYVWDRAEGDTTRRIEHVRLVEDVGALKRANEALTTRLRDAEEALRRNATRIEDLQDRQRRTSP